MSIYAEVALLYKSYFSSRLFQGLSYCSILGTNNFYYSLILISFLNGIDTRERKEARHVFIHRYLKDHKFVNIILLLICLLCTFTDFDRRISCVLLQVMQETFLLHIVFSSSMFVLFLTFFFIFRKYFQQIRYEFHGRMFDNFPTPQLEISRSIPGCIMLRKWRLLQSRQTETASKMFHWNVPIIQVALSHFMPILLVS